MHDAQPDRTTALLVQRAADRGRNKNNSCYTRLTETWATLIAGVRKWKMGCLMQRGNRQTAKRPDMDAPDHVGHFTSDMMNLALAHLAKSNPNAFASVFLYVGNESASVCTKFVERADCQRILVALNVESGHWILLDICKARFSACTAIMFDSNYSLSHRAMVERVVKSLKSRIKKRWKVKCGALQVVRHRQPDNTCSGLCVLLRVRQLILHKAPRIFQDSFFDRDEVLLFRDQIKLQQRLPEMLPPSQATAVMVAIMDRTFHEKDYNRFTLEGDGGSHFAHVETNTLSSAVSDCPHWVEHSCRWASGAGEDFDWPPPPTMTFVNISPRMSLPERIEDVDFRLDAHFKVTGLSVPEVPMNFHVGFVIQIGSTIYYSEPLPPDVWETAGVTSGKGRFGINLRSCRWALDPFLSGTCDWSVEDVDACDHTRAHVVQLPVLDGKSKHFRCGYYVTCYAAPLEPPSVDSDGSDQEGQRTEAALHMKAHQFCEVQHFQVVLSYHGHQYDSLLSRSCIRLASRFVPGATTFTKGSKTYVFLGMTRDGKLVLQTGQSDIDVHEPQDFLQTVNDDSYPKTIAHPPPLLFNAIYGNNVPQSAFDVKSLDGKLTLHELLISHVQAMTIRGVNLFYLLQRLADRNGVTYPVAIVGGAIRDLLLGKEPNDIDIVVGAESYTQLQYLLNDLFGTTGESLTENTLFTRKNAKRFGQMKIINIEVSISHIATITLSHTTLGIGSRAA